jgi:hypothetical protein
MPTPNSRVEAKTRNGLVVIGRDARLIMTDKRWETIVDGTSGTEAVQTERGKVWLEWVGQPSPYDDTTIRYLIATHGLPPKVENMLRLLSQRRIMRIDGVSVRIMPHGDGLNAIKGLSQTWRFGKLAYVRPGTPQSYIQLVPNRDADLILGSNVGNEFRVIGLAVTEDDPVLQATARVKRGRAEVRLGKTESFRDQNAFHRAMGKGHLIPIANKTTSIPTRSRR